MQKGTWKNKRYHISLATTQSNRYRLATSPWSFIVFIMLLCQGFPIHAKTLHSAIEADVPPLTLIDEHGEPAGFSVELLQIILDMSGDNITYIPQPWEKTAATWANGNLDLLPLVAITEERKKTYLFSDPYLTLNGTLVTRKESGWPISLEDFQNRKLGISSSSYNEEFAREHIHNAILIQTNSYHDALHLLAEDKLDAVLMLKLSAQRMILSEHAFSDLVVGEEIENYRVEFAFASHHDNPELIAKINAGLASVRSSGIYDYLKTEWLGNRESGFDYHALMVYILIISLSLVISWFIAQVWQRSLLAKVKATTRELRQYQDSLEQKVSERTRELELEKENLHQTQAIAHLGSYHWQIENNLTTWTPELFRIVGHSSDTFEPSYNNYISCIHPDDREKFILFSGRVLKNNTDYSNQYRVQRPNGEIRHVLETGHVEHDNLGNVSGLIGTIQDITEQKTTEDRVRQREQQYKDLLETTPDWVWEINKEGKYIYSSPKVSDLLGYEARQLIGKSPLELMPGDEALRMKPIFQNYYKEQQAFFNMESIKQHARGHRVILETSGTPVFNEHDQLIGYRGVSRDVTRRKENEKALKAQRDFNETLIDIAGNIIVVLDMHGRFTLFNKAAEKLTGFSSEEVIDKPLWDYVIPPEIRAEIHHVFKLLFNHQTELAGEYENEWLTKSGSRRLIHWHNSILLDEAGNVSHIIAVGYDITEQNKAEMALKEQEKILRQILDHLPSMVFLKEARELSYIQFNRTGLKLTGLSSEQILGKKDTDLFPKEQAAFFNRKDRAVLSAGEIEDIPREPLDTPSGTRILHTRKIPILDNDGNPEYLLGISDDITEQIQQEEEHSRIQRELQQSRKMESLGQLTGGVAHDFNNMLAIIGGYASLAMDYGKARDDETLCKYMENLSDASARAARLVEQMLAFTRREQTRAEPENLAILLKNDLSLIRATLPTSIRITTHIDENIPMVTIDKTQFNQVLMNIAVNARDAMAGSGKLDIRLQLKENLNLENTVTHKSIQGNWIELSIADTGTGIDESLLESIFDPFFTTKDVGKGTGMGLSVIYGIVDNHGGHIVVESEQGKGTTFRIFLPPSEEHPDPVSESHRRDDINRQTGDGSAILVIDDEVQIGEFMKLYLGKQGYQTDYFADSAKALEHFRKIPDRYALVISDQTMPGITGLELIRAIRNIRPSLPAILCSGFSDELTPELMDELEIHFLQKPISNGTLAETAHKLILKSSD